MAKQNNKTCIICGKNYTYCPVCNSGDANKPTWYFIFDGQNCHDIYEVCTQYRDGEIDAKVAYEKISKLDISDLDNFPEVTQSQIKEIIANGKESKTIVDKVKANNTKNENKK